MPNVILIIYCFAITINQMHMCLDRLSFHLIQMLVMANYRVFVLFYLFHGFFFSLFPFEIRHSFNFCNFVSCIHHSIESNALRIWLKIQHNPNTNIVWISRIMQLGSIFHWFIFSCGFFFAWYFVSSSKKPIAIHDLFGKLLSTYHYYYFGNRSIYLPQIEWHFQLRWNRMK